MTEKTGRKPEVALKKFLRNKKIIIVGPAGYLQSKGKGRWIDSFDVVVRINHAIPVKYPDDYGSRTDVLYHILSHRSRIGKGHKQLVERSEIEMWKKHGVKWLVSRHHSKSNRVAKMAPVIGDLIDWVTMREMYSDRIKRMVKKKSPNTGIMAIAHLIAMPIESLYVVGFDFYQSGVYEGYGDVREGEEAQMVNSRWHDNQAQIEFLKEIYKSTNKLFPDDVLEAILCRR